MPGTTGGRTPDAPDRGVCAISPSDLVGYVGNLISRVEELEQRVEELQSGNVVVGQVTSLSQQIGWASGITYMGTSGWTQTEYGTLIPPPGVTLASLGIFPATGTGTGAAPANSLQFILKDENGDILFAFNAIDGLYGDTVDYWNAGGAASGFAAMDYFDFNYCVNASSSYQNSRGTFTILNAADSSDGTWEVQVARAGLYLITAHYSVTKLGAGDFSARIELTTSDDSGANPEWTDYQYKAGGSGTVSSKTTRLQLLTAGATITTTPNVLTAGETIRVSALQAVRLSG